MAPAAYYRRKARECERLASETEDTPLQARLYRTFRRDFARKAAMAEAQARFAQKGPAPQVRARGIRF
jgi:hypothetical protein